MQSCISYNHRNEFKVALVYLEQWEVLGFDYGVFFDGYCDSPYLRQTAEGSLGFTADWYIRPRKGKNLLRLVRDKCLSKSRRHSSLRKLFYFKRRVVDREIRAAELTHKSKRWSAFLSDYLAKKRTERGLEPPESRDYVRCPIDKEVEDILIQVATLTTTDWVV
jgi:hypothetical protein